MKLPSSPQVGSASAGPMGPFGFPQRYLIVFLTFLCTSVCYIERLGFSLAYTSMAIRSGVDQATKGWVMSAFYCGYASSQVPGSWAAQRFGGRRVLTVSFIFWSILCVLTPTEPGPLLSLVLIRLLVGVAQGFIFPSIHTVLAQWIPPHEKSRSVSLTTSGMYFGAGLAMLCLPNLVAVKGPETVFQMVAVMGAAWAAVWVRYSTEPRWARQLRGSPTSQKQRIWTRHPGRLGREDPVGCHHGEPPCVGNCSKQLHFPLFTVCAHELAAHLLRPGAPCQPALHRARQERPLLHHVPLLQRRGVVADYLIAKRLLSVTATRKVLNTLGFFTSSVALALMPVLASVRGALFCSSVALGACALARAGFAVNHMDIAPRYAGIVMGVSRHGRDGGGDSWGSLRRGSFWRRPGARVLGVDGGVPYSGGAFHDQCPPLHHFCHRGTAV